MQEDSDGPRRGPTWRANDGPDHGSMDHETSSECFDEPLRQALEGLRGLTDCARDHAHRPDTAAALALALSQLDEALAQAVRQLHSVTRLSEAERAADPDEQLEAQDAASARPILTDPVAPRSGPRLGWIEAPVDDDASLEGETPPVLPAAPEGDAPGAQGARAAASRQGQGAADRDSPSASRGPGRADAEAPDSIASDRAGQGVDAASHEDKTGPEDGSQPGSTLDSEPESGDKAPSAGARRGNGGGDRIIRIRPR